MLAQEPPSSVVCRRPAVPLVELLATIGIVGLLAGLLLGGVHAARDATDHAQDALTAQAIAVQKEAKDVEVCPIGEAWRNVREERPEFALFTDGNHASQAGSYLTACVFHAVLHRVSPVGLPHDIATETGTRVAVDKATAVFLQQTAWQVAERFQRRLKPDFLKPK